MTTKYLASDPDRGSADLTVRRRTIEGLGLGLFYGLVFATMEVLAIALTARLLWSMWVNPFTPLIASLYVQEALQLGLLGALLGVVGGRRLERRPYRFLVILTLCVAPLPFLLATTAPLVVVAALAAGLLASHAVLRLFRWRRPAGAVALAFLLASPVPLLRLLPSAPGATVANQAQPPAGAPNVLWVIFDTTRADHLSLYGYSRKTSPHLDQLAADAAVFTEAYSTAPWTAPSHASMLTGLYPRQHGCTFEHTYLSRDIPYLPEMLTAAGYDTALFAGNPWLDAHSGLDRGFLRIFPSWRSSFISWFTLAGAVRGHTSTAEVDKGARDSNLEFERWLSDRNGSRPFFAFVNYTEAHAPYADIPSVDRNAFMPEGVSFREQRAVDQRLTNAQFRTQYDIEPVSASDREIAEAMYDGGIRYEDRRFGELIALLRSRGQLDNTLVIVTADHGELLGEHGEYGHDQTLFHPLVRVPLVVRWPGRVPAGVRIDAPVQLTDLFATVLELTGQSKLQTPGTTSLLPLLDGKGAMDRPVFAELYPPLRSPRAVERLRKRGLDPLAYRFTSVQVSSTRFIRGPAQKEALFDLGADPGEERDLTAERTAQTLEMRARLEQFERDHPKGKAPSQPAGEIDAMTRQKLEALGYSQ